MDNKNVFIAVALSMSVLLFWGAFFEKPKPIDQNKLSKKEKIENNSKSNIDITPSVNQLIKKTKISRKDSVLKSKRVKIENEKIIGSLSLEGAIIDDISFKNYKKDIKKDGNVSFLNPKETEDEYYIETGWTSIGNSIEVPTSR